MKSSDRSVLLGLVILGIGAAFWFMFLAPKRERAGELETQVTELRADVTAQEQSAATAEQARVDYASNFESLVVLGRAAPENGDTPALLTQLEELSNRSGTDFQSLVLEGSDSTAPPAPAAQTTTDQNAEEGTPTSETPAEPGEATTASPVPATEATAAALPLGASVGPAGLGVMPYSLQFSGSFFEIADLLAAIDAQVRSGKQGALVDGRLLTIDGFTMNPLEGGDLSVELSATSYVLPASQGLTAGATPTAPPTAVPTAAPLPAAPAP